VKATAERLAKPLLQCRAHLTHRFARNLMTRQRIRPRAPSRKTRQTDIERLSNTMHARRSNVREARGVQIMTPEPPQIRGEHSLGSVRARIEVLRELVHELKRIQHRQPRRKQGNQANALPDSSSIQMNLPSLVTKNSRPTEQFCFKVLEELQQWLRSGLTPGIRRSFPHSHLPFPHHHWRY